MAKSSPSSAKTPKTERISPDDFEYHVKMVDRIKWAQEAEKNIEGIRAAWLLWTSHLADKYKLDNNDDINEAGQVVRKP